jgi:hypothetical protein
MHKNGGSCHLRGLNGHNPVQWTSRFADEASLRERSWRDVRKDCLPDKFFSRPFKLSVDHRDIYGDTCRQREDFMHPHVFCSSQTHFLSPPVQLSTISTGVKVFSPASELMRNRWPSEVKS